MTRSLSLILLLASTSACVEDLAPPSDDTDPLTSTDDTDDTGQSDPDDPIVFEGPDGEGTVLADVDATDAQAWVHLDLAEPTWTQQDGPWSLKFQRYTIALNGGVSGDGDVQAVFVPDLDFDQADQAPADGWSTDAPDADEDGEPEYVFGEWYDYDPGTHVLTPKPGTWFVRDIDGDVWALEIVDYYSDAGDSGHPEIRFRPVDQGG